MIEWTVDQMIRMYGLKSKIVFVKKKDAAEEIAELRRKFNNVNGDYDHLIKESLIQEEEITGLEKLIRVYANIVGRNEGVDFLFDRNDTVGLGLDETLTDKQYSLLVKLARKESGNET